MPVTRHKAALRRAEGLPPSPQNEDDLPRELRARQRRPKRAPRSNRSTATPESEEDRAQRQDQEATAQALREGNAGGYVTHSASEQKDLLSESPFSSSPSQLTEGTGTSTAGALPANVPLDIPRAPRSSIISSLSIIQSPNTSNILSNSKSALKDLHIEQPLKAQVTNAKSVSTQTDGQYATVTSPSVTTTASPKTTQPSVRTASTQTGVPAERFKPLGLYDFRSELSVLPDTCRITLHIGTDRDIRVSNLSPNAMDEIKNFLHSHHFVYERSWLTSEEAVAESAAAEAAEKQALSSNKRKRDDLSNTAPDPQRRRIETTPTSKPKVTSTPGPSKLRSRLRMKGDLSGPSHAAKSPMQQVLSPTHSSKSSKSTVDYGQNGNLRLLGETSQAHQHKTSDTGIPSAQMAATLNGSDEEGEPEGVLLFPNCAVANKAMFGDSVSQAVDTSAQAGVTAPELSVNGILSNSFPEIERSSSNESTIALVETPQRNSWGFGSLFNTARRFMPSIRRQRVALAASQTNRPVTHSQNETDNQHSDLAQREVQTEPRRQERRIDLGPADSASNFEQRLRDSQSITHKAFRTKENIEEMRKMKAEKERLKAEWAKLEEERRITEQERQDVEDAHRAAYASLQPGSKRRLRTSPRVIPNPKGVSYGLDPAYFDNSDSDEDEEPSPSRFRPRKARRINEPDQSLLDKDGGLKDQNNSPVGESSGGDALRYLGSRFSDSPPNVFSLSNVRSNNSNSGSKNTKSYEIRKDDPNFNRMGHFSVPLSPSSSEDDDTEGETEEASSENRTLKQSRSEPSAKHISGDQSLSVSAAATPTNTTAPPPLQQPKTPIPREGTRAVRFAKDNDPSRTLEQSRQNLRAQLLKQGGKSVLSPKDIPPSSMKSHQTPSQVSGAPVPDFATAGQSSTVQRKELSNSRASDEESLFIQPIGETTAVTTTSSGAQANNGVQEDEEDVFDIRGAASRGPQESPQQLPAETLPNMPAGISSQLQAYQTFQQAMDSATKDFLESSWEARDNEASTNAFQLGLSAHCAPEEQAAESEAAPTTSEASNVGPFVDDPDDYEDDSTSIQRDLIKPVNQEHKAPDQPLSAAQLNTTSIHDMDPAIAAFMRAHWTPDDEAYASDQFKKDYNLYEEPKDGATDVRAPINVTA